MMGIFQKMMRPLLLEKARKVESHMRPFIKGPMLDIGAGRCYIARQISKVNGIDVSAIDVEDLNQTDMHLRVYDGRKIPFKKDSFKSVLIAYVLHHCENQLQVLEEAKRVCDGNIIIFEDTVISPITKLSDFIANRLHGVDTPFKFHDKEGWIKIFHEHDFEVVRVEDDVEKEWFYPLVKHTMFVVKRRGTRND